jgi:hypothetical protein
VVHRWPWWSHQEQRAPGWQVLQRGMEKFVAFAAGWCAREALVDF